MFGLICEQCADICVYNAHKFNLWANDIHKESNVYFNLWAWRQLAKYERQQGQFIIHKSKCAFDRMPAYKIIISQFINWLIIIL